MNYSFIIPHYNLPNLLERCLKSIPARDDIQVIVVDDCSSEENKAKLKVIACKYSNVQIIYQQENQGGGAARNAGLAVATGTYVLFADADDYFCEGFINILDEFASKKNDLTFFNVNFIDEETGEKLIKTNYVKQIIDTYNTNSSKGEKLLRFSFGEPWCKLILRSVIVNNNIRFDQTNIHNDTLFSYLIGFFATKIAVCSTPIYNYIVRSGSVSKSLSSEKILTRTKIFAQKNRFLIDNHIPFFDNLMLRSFKYCRKNKDLKLYNQCLEIVKQFGFTRIFIERKLFFDKLNFFIQRRKQTFKKIFSK